MGRRRLYCATLSARRTKRLDQRHEIARDRDVVSSRDCLETETTSLRNRRDSRRKLRQDL